METGWYYATEYREPCRVVESQAIWGQEFSRVWLPVQDAVVRVRSDTLLPLAEAKTCSADYVAYLTAAARISEALTQDILLAPAGASIIPLPHQIRALSQAISGDRIRYLLADEVGLGKTIEAGLIMKELKMRGLVSRTLIVVPKGLVIQWLTEMQNRFSEVFQAIIPGEIRLQSSLAGASNIWRNSNQVICPMDSVKPLDGRRGWSTAQVEGYNSKRFEDLITAGWDLVIVDEAHRLGGSTDQVARHRLGVGLAEAAPYLLLLSATPHQGKTDSFHRIMSLLDSKQFPDPPSITHERVRPYVIRTEKRRAIDIIGNPLFKPRETQLEPVGWKDKHQQQRLLYDAITDYVRHGYNQAVRERRSYIGFLMLLMQRLVVSSTDAISAMLERRAEILEAPEEQLVLLPTSLDEELDDMDGQEQLDTILKARLMALMNERAQVSLLLDAARQCMETTTDAKAEALLDWIYRLQQEDNDPELKILVFTEFVATQEMLRRFLSERGFSIVCLNGSMDIEQRMRVQESFAGSTRILVSTDAGGEGLNLQFCHVVINYDIPWNPMRLEQRIGRVDRIGQEHSVRAVNFALEDSVEYRVLEVLEQKLAVILKEFGVDKTADVLDSAAAQRIFDTCYLEAVLHPENIEASVDSAVAQVKDQASERLRSSPLLGGAEELTEVEVQILLDHPLPHWIERMVLGFLRANNGRVEKKQNAWNLVWPDGVQTNDVVFTTKAAVDIPSSHYLSLEDDRVRTLLLSLPRMVPGQPIPIVSVPELQTGLTGAWYLAQIGACAEDQNQRRILASFLHDDGRVLMPTGRYIWDLLLSTTVRCEGYEDDEDSTRTFSRVMESVETHAEGVFQELLAKQNSRLDRERQKGEYAFAARRRILSRIGLQSVRAYRIKQLEEEERIWREQMYRRGQVFPDVIPLLIIRIREECSHE